MCMKMILFLTVVLSLGVHGNALSQRVSLDLKNAELRQVFRQLKQQTGLLFVYNEEELDKTQRVTLQVSDQEVKEVLDQLFSTLPYTYEIIRDMVAISPAPGKSSIAQSPQNLLRITGRVTDERNQPLPGVTVVVKGTTVGMSTDGEGHFTLSLPERENVVLLFSCIGMKSTEVVYAGQSELQVTLKEDVTEIDDVVVTGIFTKARESYTGAVTTVTSQQLALFRGQNLITTLRNIDPALHIVANNLDGSNPNVLPEVTLRGSSSLPVNVQEFNEGVKNNLNTPLIIMDGFEISLQKLMDYNDEEIESINILKDAASTAIYGSRGANGVIVIVSKQPEPGSLRINIRAGLDFEIPDLSSYDLLNAAEKLKLEFDNHFYDDLHPSSDRVLKQRYNGLLRDVLEGTDTDWLSKPLHTGVSQRYNIRLEGGSSEFRWGVSVACNQIAGAMKNSSRENITGEIILSYHYKNVIFKNQTNLGFNNAKNSNYGSFSDYADMNPYWKVYDREGRLIPSYTATLGAYYGIVETVANPLYNASLKNIDKSAYTDIINNFSIEWDILKGLKLRGQIGFSKQYNSSDRFISPNNSLFLEAPYNTGDGVLRRGRYTYSDGESMNYDGNVTISYSKTFHRKHQLYAGLDYSVSQRKNYLYTFEAEGFTNENINSLGGAMRYAQNSRPAEEEGFTRRVGLTGNVNYTYDNRYFADLSLRMDGSSQFGTDNRFAPFWSAGIGWNLHREHFLADCVFIDKLRLRFSCGQTGSQQFSPFQALSTYAYYMDHRYGNWGGAYLQAHGNEKLKWQLTDQLNVGLELGAFKNRLTLSFDYYNNKTANLLSELATPLATGFGSFIANVGAVKNTGFEAALGGYLIRDTERQIIWTLNGKLAYNKNEITRVSEAIKAQNELYIQQDVDVSTLFYEGYSQNALYVVRSQGIDPSTGNEVFLDRHGNITHTWSPSDKVYAGNGEPAYRGNLSTMVRWQNLTLNLSFGYHWGGVMYNQTLVDRVELTRENIGRRNVDRRVMTDRWSTPGEYAQFKRIASMEETEDTQTRASTRFVMDDRMFELQSASLQYRMENDWFRSRGISSATLSVNASDLFHLSSVKRERGINYPFARRMGLNLTLVF